MLGVAPRTVAVAAGVFAVSLAAAPAFATTTTTAKPTSITVKAAHSIVAPKQKDTLTATLKSGTHLLAGDTVKLERRAFGTAKWSLVATKTTNKYGRAAADGRARHAQGPEGAVHPGVPRKPLLQGVAQRRHHPHRQVGRCTAPPPQPVRGALPQDGWGTTGLSAAKDRVVQNLHGVAGDPTLAVGVLTA